jgi:hypothetical protein
MTDIALGDIPIFTDSKMLDDMLLLVDRPGYAHYVFLGQRSSGSEEDQVRNVVARLLDYPTGLSFDLLRYAVDKIITETGRGPAYIVVSPVVRKEYLKMLEAARTWP